MGCFQNKGLDEPEEIITIEESILQQSKNSIINQTNEHKALICKQNLQALDSTTLINSPQLLLANEGIFLDFKVEPISVKQIFSPQNTVKNILTGMVCQEQIEEQKQSQFPKNRKPQQQKRKRNRIDMNDLEKQF